jgi:hypothetical protein
VSNNVGKKFLVGMVMDYNKAASRFQLGAAFEFQMH